MKYTKWVGLGLSLVILFPVPALQADIFIYPAKGQSQEQQESDKYECHSWAVQQTGFDPMKRPTASAPPPAAEAPQGGLLRGAARGATVGVIGGAIGGSAEIPGRSRGQ